MPNLVWQDTDDATCTERLCEALRCTAQAQTDVHRAMIEIRLRAYGNAPALLDGARSALRAALSKLDAAVVVDSSEYR